MARAVVQRVKLPDGSTLEDDQKMLTDFVIPHAKSLAGFLNGTWVRDDEGNGIGVIAFDTDENAAAAQEALKPPAGVGPELVSSNLYEVGGQA